MDSKEKYLNKIKKLLNLARKSTNASEAANAMRQAQNLMRAHKLTAQDIDLMEISEVSSKGAPSNAVKIPGYMRMLIGIIRHAFGVQSYLSWKIGKRTVVFYGPDERPQIAAYAFDVLTRQMMAARKEFSAGQRKSIKRATKTGRADAFCEAWVHGAYQVIEAFAVTPEEKGLMEAYYRKISGDFVTVPYRPAKKVRGDEGARGAGFIAGTSATLNHGVGGTSDVNNKPLRIGR